MKIKIFFTAVILAFAVVSLYSQQRNISVAGNKAQASRLYKESHALVIGDSDYANWDKLIGVKADVPEVAKALQEQGFQVETESNLTSDRLKARVEKFISDYGYNRDSRLLIYFAGHGATYTIPEEDREVGYIIPIDTPRMPTGSNISEQSEAAFLRKAISMDTFDGWAKNIKAKHALFVFDSCFSGRFVPRSEIRPSEIVEDALEKPTRQFLTSGAANQTASDNSEFRKVFVQGLRGDADLTGDGFVTVTELAIFVRDRVAEYSSGKQTPQYGTIRESALDGGDMVFRVSEQFEYKNEAQAESAWKRVIKNDPQALREFIKIYSNTMRGREAIALLGKLESQATKRSSSPALRPVRAKLPERNSGREQNSTEEQNSSRETNSAPVPVKKLTVTKDSITFELKRCELNEKELTCSFSIVSNGKDINYFRFYSGYSQVIIDGEGNEVHADGYKASSTILIDSIPISGTITFTTTNLKMTKIARFDVGYRDNDDQKQISFRNIPVTKNN